MPQQVVRIHQRGSFVKITLSIMKHIEDYTEVLTDPININDMAEVVVKSKGLSNPQNYIQQSIKFKNCDNKNNLPVLLDITSDEFNKQIICPDEWLEILIKEKHYDLYIHGKPITASYITEVNITAHAVFPVPSSICSKMYEETELVDFKLLGEDGTVPVHKSVLFVHSETFRTMLRGNWKETEEDIMKMPGMTVKTLQHLKQYMYLGTIPDEDDGTILQPLLALAKRCLMDNLATACIEKLLSTVKVETFDGLVEFACQNNIPELVRGLVLRAPDHVVNGISKMEYGRKNSNDKSD